MRDLTIPIQASIFPHVMPNIVSTFDETSPFPSTRYQGSKNKLTDWIWENISELEFDSALDAFGGTGAVSHMLKRKGKRIIYNDILRFNHIIGKALIENDRVRLSDKDIDSILTNDTGTYDFIQNTFSGIFYTDDENAWLDRIIYNIHQLDNEYKRALAMFALFQSCIIKRPYNLFHRANLYLRLSDVKRSFGNKTSWDRSFDEYFRHFAGEANSAIFSNEQVCSSLNSDALELSVENVDLVYLDTPYISKKGMGTDYLNFYHFLEGIANYDKWSGLICEDYKHIPIKKEKKCPWIDKGLILDEFEKIIKKFSQSKIVISYRSDGIPSIEQLRDLMKKYKQQVSVVYSRDYKYALSSSGVKEVLIIGV